MACDFDSLLAWHIFFISRSFYLHLGYCVVRYCTANSNLTNLSVHLERRSCPWERVVGTIQIRFFPVGRRMRTSGRESGVDELLGTQYPQPANMGVFPIHMVCEDDDLKNIGMDRFARAGD